MKLCDFGFARILPGSNEGMTDYVATRWYRAPELLLSIQNYGKPVDLWAIACIMGELVDGQPLFPGESEIDQLYLIQKMLGPLPADQRELFLKNPRFLGNNFPPLPKAETLERRYIGKLSKKALSFMKALLRLEPSERLNSTEALQHSYFEGLKDNNDIIFKNNSRRISDIAIAPQEILGTNQYKSPANNEHGNSNEQKGMENLQQEDNGLEIENLNSSILLLSYIFLSY